MESHLETGGFFYFRFVYLTLFDSAELYSVLNNYPQSCHVDEGSISLIFTNSAKPSSEFHFYDSISFLLSDYSAVLRDPERRKLQVVKTKKPSNRACGFFLF